MHNRYAVPLYATKEQKKPVLKVSMMDAAAALPAAVINFKTATVYS